MAVITPQADPPPPLKAQKRSEFVPEFTVINSPSAFTNSTSKILSTPKPYPGENGPWPPPIDHPIIPTVGEKPDAMSLLF